MEKPQAKWQVSLLIGIFLIVLIGCATPPATPTSSGVVISTFTAVPANSPTVSEISTPTLAPNSEIIGQLPGLSPVNVTVGLEGQKFTCTAVKKVGSYYERTCLKGLPSEVLYQVLISGREPFLVDFIEGSVRQAENPDTKVAAEFLGFMASMSYDGAASEDAKAWVESTIPTLDGEAQEMAFGGVKYVLSGSPKALTLEMGELP